MTPAPGDAALGDAGVDAGEAADAEAGETLETGEAVEAGEAVDAGPLPGFTRMLPPAEPRRFLPGETSEGPSESSTCRSGANVGDDTEEDDFKDTIPHLERFYEQLAAKAKLPERHGAATQNWVLSLARSYRRLSKEKRRRGGLRALLQQPTAQGGLSAASGSGLPCPVEQPGFSSNTDDSGYEAGYETDADESELSEWETASASQRQQRHKRKLDALVHLTMKLSFAEHGSMEGEEHQPWEHLNAPPLKTYRVLDTQSVGTRLSLPHNSSAAPLTSPSERATPLASPFSWPLKPLCNSTAGGAAAVGAVTVGALPAAFGACASVSESSGAGAPGAAAFGACTSVSEGSGAGVPSSALMEVG